MQGDVTHIINTSGTVIAQYTYDTWGKLISIKDGIGTDITNTTTSIGYINPIRYRGYYYDNETGFYYLESRYYDPAIGRFINADEQLNIGEGSIGFNLFCYCGNNPVNRFDSNGERWDPSGVLFQFVVSVSFFVVFTGASFFIEDIRKDMKLINYNPFNSNEDLMGHLFKKF